MLPYICAGAGADAEAELLDWYLYLRFDDLSDSKLHDMLQDNDKAI